MISTVYIHQYWDDCGVGVGWTKVDGFPLCLLCLSRMSLVQRGLSRIKLGNILLIINYVSLLFMGHQILQLQGYPSEPP